MYVASAPATEFKNGLIISTMPVITRKVLLKVSELTGGLTDENFLESGKIKKFTGSESKITRMVDDMKVSTS